MEEVSAAYAATQSVQDVLCVEAESSEAQEGSDSRGGLHCWAKLVKGPALSREEKSAIHALLQSNMKAHFRASEWARVLREKRREAEHKEALNLLLYLPSSPPLRPAPDGAPAAAPGTEAGPQESRHLSPSSVVEGGSYKAHPPPCHLDSSGPDAATSPRAAKRIRGDSTDTVEVGGASETAHGLPANANCASGAPQQEAPTSDHPAGPDLRSAPDVASRPGPGEDEPSSASELHHCPSGCQPRSPPEGQPQCDSEDTAHCAQECHPQGLPEGKPQAPSESPAPESRPGSQQPHAAVRPMAHKEHSEEPQRLSSPVTFSPLPLHVPKAEGRGPLRGFVHFRFVEEEGLPVLYVYELQLSDGVQGHGLGSALLSHLCKCAARVQMQALMLTVQRSNVRAISFYTQRHRFSVAHHSPAEAPYVILSHKV